MKRIFEWYHYAVPGLGFPAMAWVWARELGPGPGLAFMFSLVAFGYVIPGLGTNVTQLYEFRSQYRLGRMRPHQGFVLSTFAAGAAWLGCHLGGWLSTAIICALVVTVYDAAAIRSGFIVVYNRPYFEGKGALAVALDYAPVFFFAYGAVLGLFAEALKRGGDGPAFFIAWTLALMCAPVAALSAWSFLRHGRSGLWPWAPGRA
jgi:hypothetical protein